MEDIDQESKSALNEDDLVRILEFNEKVDNEESFRLTVHPKTSQTRRDCSFTVVFCVARNLKPIGIFILRFQCDQFGLGWRWSHEPYGNG